MKLFALSLTFLTTLVAKPSFACSGIVGAFSEGKFAPVYVSEGTPEYLKDHKISGTVIVSAASFLDAAITAARSVAGNSDSASLSSVTLRKPLILSPVPRELKTQIINGKVTILTKDIHLFATVADQMPEKIVLDPPQASGRVYSSRDLYRALSDVGLQYGPSFQAMSHYTVKDRLVFADLSLKLPMESHSIHPTLITSGFHALAAIHFVEAGGIFGDEMYVPGFFGEVSYWKPRPNNTRFFAVGHITRAERGRIVYDLVIDDDQGTRVLQIKNGTMFSFKL